MLPDQPTDDLQRRICDLLRVGNRPETAARASGISPATHSSWMERGELDGAEHELYRSYRDAVDEALAQAESLNVTLIAKQARTDWRAAQYLLEHANPDRWGKQAEKPSGGDLPDFTPAPATAPADE